MDAALDSVFDDDGDSDGYFLVSRKLRRSEIFLNPPMLQMLLFCIDAAAFKPQRVPMRTGATITYVDLDVGQFITGRNSGAKELCVPPATFWDRLKKLEATGVVVITSNSYFSVVTVCNYARYQNAKKPCRQRKQQGSVTASQQPGDSPVTQRKKSLNNSEVILKEESEATSDPLQEVLDAWNAAGTVRKTRTLGDTRRRHLKTRLSDPEWNWREALAKFPLPLCESDPSGWQPDFDWFIEPNSVNKILEGKYDWRKDTKNGNRSNRLARQPDPGLEFIDPEEHAGSR